MKLNTLYNKNPLISFILLFIISLILNILYLNIVFGQENGNLIPKKQNNPSYPLLIVGDVEAVKPLTYTDYLDGKPVLFFSKAYQTETPLNLLKLANTVVFYQGGTRELCLDLLPPKVRNINKKEYTYRLIPQKNGIIFFAPFETDYEIFIRSKQRIETERDKLVRQPAFLLDNKIPYFINSSAPFNKEEGGSWQHMGMVLLSYGKHVFTVQEEIEEIIVIPQQELYKYYREVIELLSQKDKVIFIFCNAKNDNFFSKNLVVSHTDYFDLRVKCLPRIQKKYVYLQGKDKINWDDEITKWQFGFLPEDENLVPIIIYKENFYPREEDFSGKFNWMSNNGRFLAINPLEIAVKTNFSFEALSDKRERNLEILINGIKKEIVSVPKDKEFRKFIIKDIILNPGKNEIIFFLAEGADKLKPEQWQEAEEKEVSIKFKDDFKFEIKEKLGLLKEIEPPDYKYVVSDEGLELAAYIRKREDIFLMSKSLDIDLEEYPYLNLDFELSQPEKPTLEFFLGIDYSGDGVVDGYLNPENLKDINLFELAKDKWQDVDYFEYGFKLKKIILLLQNKEKDLVSYLSLKNLQIHNQNSSVLIPLWLSKSTDLKVIDVDNLDYKTIHGKDTSIISTYFDSKTVGTEIGKKERKKILQDEGIFLEIHFEGKKVIEEGGVLILTYKLDNPEVQNIELFFDLGKKQIMAERIEPSKPSLIYEGFEELEIPVESNLQDKIKKVILKLKINKAIEVKGWFNFFIKEIGFYRRFPYPVKTEKEKIIKILYQSNISLLKLDDRLLRLSDFELPKEFEDLERDVLVKKIELAKGEHKYEKLENPAFDIEWVIFEPITNHQSPITKSEPDITFRKINPTKYLVKVESAKEPFWLVFSESFHRQWKLYQMTEDEGQITEFKEIIADYSNLKIKEARHFMKFTPEDIKYIFEKPLEDSHHLVNGYANGWYIEPEKLGLGENFILVLYFWPQSLFYLGLGISGLTLLGCTSYLLWPKRKDEK